MLQRQIMLKQLQEMRQQQQLQELGGLRQQNYLNQLSYLNKQTSSGLHASLVNGMPVHEASQKFMVGNAHLTQHGTSPIIQGFPNGFVLSQAQSQAMSMGLLSQQSEVSLYGTPVASSGNNLNQYSHLQGVSQDSVNVFARGNNNQMEIPLLQPSAVSNSFMNGQFNAPPNKVCILDGTFSPKNVFQDKNLFGQVMPASNDGVLPLNFQQVHSLEKTKESGTRQEQTCWPVTSPGRTPKVDPSQGTTSLDPLEEKILFNSDDGGWGSVLGGQGNMGTTGFGSAHEHVDFMGIFSSTQSGSWSALMQSAVAEASSSDTGQQEEWSGLTFQNPELSADNQPANYVGNGKQQSSWADNNLQSVSSPTSKPEIIFQNSNANYNFPGFQQPNYLVSKQSDGMHSESSHESIQHSPRNARKWFDSNYQQKQPVEECQLFQAPSPLQSVWHDQPFGHSGTDKHQPNIPSYSTGQEQRENVWLRQSRSQPMVGGSQKASDQAAHILGNQDQRHGGQVKFIDSVSDIVMSSEKVNIQTNSRPAEEMPPRNTVDSIAALFDTSAGFCGQGTTGHTSENMLSKTVKSEERRTGTPSGSRDSIPESQASQIDISNEQPYYKNSSCSQGSGSGLDHQSQEVSYTTMFTSGPFYMGNHLQNQHQHVASIISQSPNAAFPGITSKFQASVATSRDASNLFQTSIGGQVFPTLDTMQVMHPSQVSGGPRHIGHSAAPPNMSSNIFNPLHGLQSEMPKVSSSLFPALDSANGIAETALGASNEQHRQNSFQIGNNVREINVFTRTTQGFDCKEVAAALLNRPEAFISASHNRAVHGQESVERHVPEATSFNSGSLMISNHQQALDRGHHRENNAPKISERDPEAFDNSFRPSPGHQQDFSLLHQVHYLRNLEASRGNKMSLKSSEADSGLIFQHANANARQLSLYGQKFGVNNLVLEQNIRSQLNSLSSGVNTLLSCSSEVGGNLLGKDPAKSSVQGHQGTSLPSQSDAHNHSKGHPDINVQIAPSWFKHYGTWKNGQMLPMNHARVVKDAGQFSTGRSFEHFGQVYNANASQQSSVAPSLANCQVAPKQQASPFLFPSDNSEQNSTALRPKKRKVASFDLLPWHKEVAQGFQQFQRTSSLAGMEWASASNKLCEKVEDEAEIYDDMLPVSRAKRRLVLTTELMQQVFRPTPAVLLSADACSNSESLIYFICRLALGDACSLASASRTAVLTSEMPSEKLNSNEAGEEDLSRIVENFILRMKRVESYLLRLDKTVSILDVKVECQELEKFSVINRFAKFHSRGHTVSVETSSSCGAALTSQKAFIQKYVLAHPMPKVVPEGSNCISL